MDELYRQYDDQYKTREIANTIPHLKFDTDWEIQIMPPFAGASVRFEVRKGNATVSVFADYFGNLGLNKKPYWEAYPYNDDVFRCPIHQTSYLLQAIRQSIKDQEESDDGVN